MAQASTGFADAKHSSHAERVGPVAVNANLPDDLDASAGPAHTIGTSVRKESVMGDKSPKKDTKKPKKEKPSTAPNSAKK
jgi:hypothetical protein